MVATCIHTVHMYGPLLHVCVYLYVLCMWMWTHTHTHTHTGPGDVFALCESVIVLYASLPHIVIYSTVCVHTYNYMFCVCVLLLGVLYIDVHNDWVQDMNTTMTISSCVYCVIKPSLRLSAVSSYVFAFFAEHCYSLSHSSTLLFCCLLLCSWPPPLPSILPLPCPSPSR